MSRHRSNTHRRDWETAEAKWPELQQFLACYFHQDMSIFHGTPENALATAIKESSLDRRQKVLKELRHFREEMPEDEKELSKMVDAGFGVCWSFAGRQFLDEVYQTVFESVKREQEAGWKQ